MGSRGQGYQTCRRMSIDTLVQQLCREDEAEFVDLWRCFIERADTYMRDGLYLSGKGAALNIMVKDIKPHIFGITESFPNKDYQMRN